MGCRVISPETVEFVSERRGFVYGAHEEDKPPAEIEKAHLRSMQRADFVWLHAPDGYVGPSAAMELGFAKALGLPVFAAHPPADIVFEELVTVVSEPQEAVRGRDPAAASSPGQGLLGLQSYYGRVARRRGWSDETPQDCLVLLTEELGELARAIRKSADIARALPYKLDDDPRLELADLQLYLVHLANVMRIDLATAVTDKERMNSARFAEAAAAA